MSSRLALPALSGSTVMAFMCVRSSVLVPLVVGVSPHRHFAALAPLTRILTP